MKHARHLTASWLRTAATAAAIGVLAACGGSTGDPPANNPPPPPPAPTPAPPPPALPFKVIPARINLAESAESTLAAFGAGAAVTWTSSDPAIAQVDANGMVRALARGSATITATDGSRQSMATVKVWRTDGGNADPSTESLIAGALTAGRISAEEALTYRVYALFGDERLPAAYEGAPDPQAAVSLRHVAGQWPTLSAATQDNLRPFLIPPIYADSWFGRQVGFATASSAQAGRVRAAQSGTTVLCSIEFVNAYLQAGLLARRTTARYNLYAFVSPLGNEAALLDSAAAEIERIDAALRNLLGRTAQSDAALACNGGDGALDIYLVDLPGEDFGKTAAYPGRCENTPAYVMINKRALSGLFRVDPQRGQRYLRTVLAHEVMHTIQYGMDRSAACADYDWIDEATAQWAPDHVYPGDNEEDGFRKLGLANALRTGVYYVDYLKGGHRESIEKANGYSTYIYFQFLARKYGAPAIKALFDAWATNGSVASLDATGVKLRDAWPEFGKALWNDVRDNVLTDLRGWDGYDYGMANVVSRDPRPLTAGRLTVDLLRANGGKIAPRSLAYERLVFTDEVSPIFLINPLGSLPQARHLKLTAVKKIGGQWRAPEDWTAEGTRYFCRDRVSERIEELLLIVSNSDPDPNATPAVLPTDVPFMLSASNVGCWKWTGQATLQAIGDDGNIRSTNTARAVDLVFEPPSDFAGGPMLLSVTAGSANGLFTLSSTLPPCNGSITGPTKTVVGADTVAAIGFNLDLRDLLSTTPDRKVGLLTGTTFIDSTQVMTCNGTTTTTPAPSTGWPWLLFPTTTNPLNVSADGKSIEANVTIPFTNARTVHNFNFTAMRE